MRHEIYPWITRDGRAIEWADLTDTHLANIIKMLKDNDHPSLEDAEMEEYTREVVDLLKLDKGKIALWLTSSNEMQRKVAKRASHKKTPKSKSKTQQKGSI